MFFSSCTPYDILTHITLNRLVANSGIAVPGIELAGCHFLVLIRSTGIGRVPVFDAASHDHLATGQWETRQYKMVVTNLTW